METKMATITPIPAPDSIAFPYEEVRANAENINNPWLREFNSKHVKYGDILNAMMGTNSSPFIRVRDDNSVVQTNTSRSHLGQVNLTIRNGIEIGGNEVVEISESGWKSPALSRAVNEFSSPSQVLTQLQNAITELNSVEARVSEILDSWNSVGGESVVKPRVDNWNNPALVTSLAGFIDTQIPTTASPSRKRTQPAGTLSKRGFILNSETILKVDTSDTVVSSSTSREKVTFILDLDDSQIGSEIDMDVYFENSSFLVYDVFEFTARSSLGSGNAVCPELTIRFRPRNSGVVGLYQGGFKVRLFNVPFKPVNDATYFQFGSIGASQNTVNWFPTGS